MSICGILTSKYLKLKAHLYMSWKIIKTFKVFIKMQPVKLYFDLF